MEFTEYWAPDNSYREGYWITRKLPTATDEKCVVDHPDAGGPCEQSIAYEVCGMPFCEMHGLEAGAGVLEELYREAYEEFERLDNTFALPLQPELLRAVRGHREHVRLEERRHHDSRNQLIRETFPLIRERVDQETLDWQPGTCEDSPVDFWNIAYAEICSLMLKAYAGQSPWLARELESYREQAAAQCAFAEIVCGEKIEAYEAAKAQ